jgi:Na+/H+ antiporter NhaD/arsenite permease-like protein
MTTAIFTVTYAGLAVGKFPGLRIDRVGIAFVGAALMLITGMLTFSQATAEGSIDYKTLALLFGMMVVVGFLRLSGVFGRLAAQGLARLRGPHALLAATVALSGVLSAFLINDVVCLALTPLVLHLARKLRCDPVPHLIALATAANIGSAGTITGNPQNIYIGSHSGIPYLRFAARLLPVAALGLVLNFLAIVALFRARLSTAEAKDEADAPEPERKPSPRGAQVWLQRKSVSVALAALVLFFTGLPLEVIALGAAAVLLLGRVRPEKVYRKIDWGLLLMFAGLFVVVHAFRVHVVPGWGVEGWTWLLERPVDLLSIVSAGLSNVVSNVPAVLLMEPVLQAIPVPARESAWLALAMSSTFAGNLTVLGSVANLIVVEQARREGIAVSFWEYSKVGVPITVLTLALGVAWLRFVPY